MAQIETGAGRRYRTDRERWAALAARERGADGLFYYAVRTTGVYCRPSCKARRANPENISFHDSRAAAEKAGFRPCKRCRPDTCECLSDDASGVGGAQADQGGAVGCDIDEKGYAILPAILTSDDCRALTAGYEDGGDSAAV